MAFQKRKQFVAKSTMSRSINKRTNCPSVGLPFLASLTVENETEIPSKFGTETCQPIRFPFDVTKFWMAFSGQAFEMDQVMADFMEQGVNMFVSGFAGIDQNPLLARKELAVNIIAEIVNEFHLDAKVL